MKAAWLRVGLAAAALASAGCAAKVVRESVLEKPGVRVELRHTEKDGAPVPRGYAQPAKISDVRVAHILASLVYTEDGAEQSPVIRPLFVYGLAEGIAAALEKAGPDDEVAAAAFPEGRRLGIFNDDRVTSFRLALVGDEMQIEFYAIEQPLERDGGKIGSREYEIPTDLPTLSARFKLVPGHAQTREGARGVNVAWRDPYYRKPVNLQFSGGQARRRTVLMEMPEGELPDDAAKAGAAPAGARPENLSDEQIRALDRLDAQRSAGSITEAAYQRERRRILENQLDETVPDAEPR